MRKFLILGLLVTLLSIVVPVPGALADEPDQTNEPITLISAGPVSSELSVTADKAQVEDDTFANTLGDGPLEGGRSDATPNTIIGSGNRERVWTTTVNPYRAVVHLEIIRADGGQDFCTGFFVRPDMIMTAGHCVYQYDRAGRPLAGRGWVNQIAVIPARSWQWENGQRVVKMPFGQDDAVRFITNTAWAGNQRPGTHDRDFGFVVLPDRTLFDGQKGTNGRINTLFRLQESVLNVGHPVTISGYPRDKAWFVPLSIGTPPNPLYPTGLWEMWTDTANISGVTPSSNNPLQYQTLVTATLGQDGAPCWYTEQGPAGPTYVAAGVYVHGTSNYNACVVFRTATISGKVTDGLGIGVDPNGHAFPVKGALVELYNTAGNLIGGTFTDANGTYTFSNVPVGQNYRLRVSLTDGGVSLTPGSSQSFLRLATIRVTDGAAGVNRGNVVYLELMVSVPNVQPQNVAFSPNQPGVMSNVAASQLNRLSDFALMYTYASNVMRYIRGTGIPLRPTGSVPSVLTVQGYSVAETMQACPVSCYDFSTQTVYLQDANSNHSARGPAAKIRFTTYHEAGHWLLDRTKGLAPIFYYQDEPMAWSPDLACDHLRDVVVDHAGFCSSITQGSWVEGFANFFVSVMKMYTNEQDPDRPIDGPRDYPDADFTVEYSKWSEYVWSNPMQELKAWEFQGELEIDDEGNPVIVIDPATGYPKRVVEFEEWAVAGLLWDLIDPSPEGANQVQYTDNLQVPASNLLQAMLVRNGQLPLHDVPDLHKILKQDQDSTLRAAFDGDADGDGVQDLDEIFVTHGFFDAPGTNVGATGGTEPVWDGDVSKIGFGGRRLSEHEMRQLYGDNRDDWPTDESGQIMYQRW